MSLQLRPRQTQAVAALRQAYGSGHRAARHGLTISARRATALPAEFTHNH